MWEEREYTREGKATEREFLELISKDIFKLEKFRVTITSTLLGLTYFCWYKFVIGEMA